MGGVVGEKFVQGINEAIKLHIPFVCFSTSGGARMQESMISLMQMAKTSAALQKLKAAKLPYISVMVDPIYGGVSGSLAMLGDINIAEPDALVGFAGEYQTEFSKINSDELIEISEQESPTKITSSLAESPNNQINIDTKVSDIKESDFDVFVLRVHVLSSKENALRIVEKVKESGFPAFTEVFGSKKNLYAVYVGPFISQDDIKLNLEQIEKIAESSSGEIIKWKL